MELESDLAATSGIIALTGRQLPVAVELSRRPSSCNVGKEWRCDVADINPGYFIGTQEVLRERSDEIVDARMTSRSYSRARYEA